MMSVYAKKSETGTDTTIPDANIPQASEPEVSSLYA
jgi:hypothetical protein